MFTNQELLERIEDAERISPFCQQCGQPTTVTERDHALWLECSGLIASAAGSPRCSASRASGSANGLRLPRRLKNR